MRLAIAVLHVAVLAAAVRRRQRIATWSCESITHGLQRPPADIVLPAMAGPGITAWCAPCALSLPPAYRQVRIDITRPGSTPGGKEPNVARGEFVARIRTYDDHDREVLPERQTIKLLDVSRRGMAETEDYLNDVLEQLVEEDGSRPRPDQYRLTVHDEDTDEVVMHWRYTRAGR